MKRLVKILTLAALGLTLSAAALSLGGCAECVRYEERTVTYRTCKRSSSTGYCYNWDSRDTTARVCVEREGDNPNYGAGDARDSSSENIQEDMARARDFVVPRKDCYDNPTRSCLVRAMEALAEYSKDDVKVHATIAVAQALAGNEREAFKRLDRSKASLALLSDWNLKFGRGDYADGISGTAVAFAGNGNGGAARKALKMASGIVPLLEAAYQRTYVQTDMATAYLALGERDTGEDLLRTLERNIPDDDLDRPLNIIALGAVMKIHADRGNDTAVRRIQALLVGMTREIEAGPLSYNSELIKAYYYLAKAVLAIGDIDAAVVAIGKLPEEIARIKGDEYHAGWEIILEDLREEVLFARKGPRSAASLASPEGIADPKERANAWIALARAHMAEGDAPAARDAVTSALLSMDRIDGSTTTLVYALLDAVKLLSSPDGKAAERAWTGQPGAALSRPAVPPGGPRLTLAERIATY